MLKAKPRAQRRTTRTAAAAPALVRGDLVGVVAASSAVDRAAVDAGVRVLERMGLRVRRGLALYDRDGIYAGSDRARERDLLAMIDDPEVRAIHFARGGWGVSRIMARIPWRALRERPKLLIGYSDLTSLFAATIDQARLSCVYGPMVAELGRAASYDRASLARAYFRPSRPLTITFTKKQVMVEGRAVGPAAGGCLSLMAHLAGTPYAPALRGRVLLLEDVAERPYQIDRMLTQLRLSGMLRGLAGVLIGGMSGCDPADAASGEPSANAVLKAALAPLGVPVVTGLRFGHVPRKLALPLGARVVVDTARRRVVFEP